MHATGAVQTVADRAGRFATSAMACYQALQSIISVRESQGYVVPDAFTHGSSAQRTRWFMTGLKSGTVSSCDAFSGKQL